jgi:uridylate kinase
VLDGAAVSLAMENDLPIVGLRPQRPDNIARVADGEAVGHPDRRTALRGAEA